MAHDHGTAAPTGASPPERRVLVVLAGAADPAADSTPLGDAERSALDRVARLGRAGVAALDARSPWEGFAALLGLTEPRLALGPAEALGLGVALGPGECAYRADFVTLVDGEVRDPFGGKVKDPEAEALLAAVRAARPGVRIVRAGGHRNVVVLPGPAEFCPSPWEMVGQRAETWLPPGGVVREFHAAAASALAEHDVNHVRLDLRENPANALWLHGGGPAAAPRAERTASSVVVGRGPCTEGVARALGWSARLVEGDDEALAAAALAALADHELVVVRTESVLDAAAAGGPAAKREALSRADARLVAPVLAALEERGSFAIAVAADSVIDAATHALSRRPVPVAVAHSDVAPAGTGSFTERACETSGWHLRIPPGAGLAWF